MTKCFFTNLQNITIEELESTKHSVEIAVAWINFKSYQKIFSDLLKRKVKIRILLNDDATNKKNLDIIKSLNAQGAQIRLVRYSGIMHHKFCIIDNSKCMFGSFNWTENANTRNIENLNICDETKLVNDYYLEFEALWELNKSDINLLKKPPICRTCKDPIFNILLFEQDGDYTTKIDIIEKCSCNQRIIYSNFFDISIYNDYIEIINQFNDEISEAEQDEDTILYSKLMDDFKFRVYQYFSFVRSNRMNCNIIHAVGVKAWEFINKHDGEFVYKIIWKERNASDYIEDEYPIY